MALEAKGMEIIYKPGDRIGDPIHIEAGHENIQEGTYIRIVVEDPNEAHGTVGIIPVKLVPFVENLKQQ